MAIPSPESPLLDPPAEGISRAKAHLLAEASHWLATGRVAHDTNEPMGRVLAQLDRAVPLVDHLAWLMWLMELRAELGGYRAMDYIDADVLEPLADLLAEIGDERREQVSRLRGGAF